MRSQEEIAARIIEIRDNDMFGYRVGVLFDYLDFEHAAPLLKPEFVAQPGAAEEWRSMERGGDGYGPKHGRVLTADDVIPAMRAYASFGWGKVRDERGISAERTIVKMQAWLWLLGDAETLAFAEDYGNYSPYGAPILRRICERYGFPVEDQDEVD